MNCSATQAIIDDYICGELGEEGQRGVRDHLETCPSCADEASRLVRYFRLIWQAEACRKAPDEPRHG